MNTEKLWKITGPIPQAKLSPLYRLATLLAAGGMVLLPLIYVGIIIGLGTWLWNYAKSGGGQGSTKGGIWLYLVPLVAGSVVLLFMIKPLFSRRPKSGTPRQLRQGDEPELFAFIWEICDAVGAPRPKRVLVDMQVNASAGPSHGLWSLLSRDLTLTIGLPLAGGLKARELGGVLAHEFGHFAQGTGMLTTYAVRVVSFWFARVVYERDRWDELLERWAQNNDWRIMIVLQISRLFVWLTRRVLWVLMLIGQFISSVLLRQMEFDADHYEIQLSGSDSFVSTAHRLRILGLGAHIANERMSESYSSRRIVDDLPGYMLHEADALPTEAREAIAKAAGEEKTGALDTHPSDTQRIAAAERAAAPGVLETDAPGAALFANFSELAREVTLRYYRDVMELPLKDVELLPLAEIAAEAEHERKGGKTMDELFHGMLSPRALIFIAPHDIVPGSGELIARNRAARQAPPEALKAEAAELTEILGRYCTASSLIALNAAKIPAHVTPDLNFRSTKTSALLDEQSVFSRRMTAIEGSLAPVFAQFHERMATALSHLLSLPDTPSNVTGEVHSYLATLASLSGLHDSLHFLRIELSKMSAVLGSLDRQTDQQASYRSLDEGAARIGPLAGKILEAAAGVAYPLPHAGGRVMLAEFLTADVAHPDPIVLTFLKGDAVLQRVFDTYTRIMGRLAVLTLESEAKMDAGDLPPSAGATPGK